MQIFDKPDNVIPVAQRGVGLGFFDGVHRGHLELLRTLVFQSRLLNLKPSVFTFPLHPETILRPEDPFDSYLCELDERLALMAGCGILETHLQDFNAEFAAIEPQEFLEKILWERLNARLVVVGQDYRFGRRGLGDADMLQQWAAEKGIEVIVVPQVNLLDGKVSSSRIRSLISEGDLVQAASLLGRPYRVGGVVVSGRGLGQRMGFPTANIPMPPYLTYPAYGVYATRTHVDGRTYESVTNIGIRPTVDNGQQIPLIETYLYDASLSLYGQSIQVDFLQRIRPEMKFESLLQLGAQVKDDLQAIREWHLTAEQCYEKAGVNDISLFVLPTRRFAQSMLSVVFNCPLDPRKSSCQSLLMRILTSSCRRYPTRTSLASALDSLYGSCIQANHEKHGDLQSISLSAEGLTRWTDGSSPFQETCKLLFEILFDPLLDESGLFDETTVETERQNLIMELDARENDRPKYAYDRCLALFCGVQAQGISSTGDRQVLQSVTREELHSAYQDLLGKTSLSLYLGGSIDPASIGICLQGMSRFPLAERPVYRPADRPAPFIPAPPANLVEQKQVEQARIVMVYAGLPPYFSHQTIVATVLNSMLGGDVHSLLFDVVREKMGLAYSVYSLNQRFLSALFVFAGVATDQVEPAVAAIRQQLANLAAGQYEPSLFERTRQMIESSILSIGDDLSSMLAQQVAGRINGRILTLTESLNLLRTVEPAQVIELASSLQLNTCYVLTSPEQKPLIEVEGCSAQFAGKSSKPGMEARL